MAKDWTKVIICSAFLMVAVAWYISTFSTEVYRVVPQQFGGGLPEELRFEIKPESVTAMKEIRIDFVPNTAITKALRVIHETDDTFSVLVWYEFNRIEKESSTRLTSVTLSKRIMDGYIREFPGLDDALSHPRGQGAREKQSAL